MEWNWRFGFVLKLGKITPCLYVGRKYLAGRNILILITNKRVVFTLCQTMSKYWIHTLIHLSLVVWEKGKLPGSV